MPCSHPLSRRTFLATSGFAMLAASGCAARAQTTDEAPVAGPDEALARLLEGNRRFVADKNTGLHEGELRRVAVAGAQTPFASVFSCVDSRVPPELIFDRGLGDLFVIRTAGQVLDGAVLGSLEFGVAELKIPLLLVLGHSECGAVKATIEAVEHGSAAPDEINVLVEGIRPAVERAHAAGGELLPTAIDANIALTVARLRETPILAQAIAAGALKVAGARYDLASGKVELVEA
jgi:carbonic anhydrase